MTVRDLRAVALTVGSPGSVVRRTILLNYVIFFGHYHNRPNQQPIKMTKCRIVARMTDPTIGAPAP